MQELSKLFNQPVDSIIHVSEVSVIPRGLQYPTQNVLTIENADKSHIFNDIQNWIAEDYIEGVRVFVYIQDLDIRILTPHHTTRTGLYQDITNEHPYLQLTIPELAGTILDGMLNVDEKKFIAFDCIKYRNIDLRNYTLRFRKKTLTNRVLKSIKISNYDQVHFKKGFSLFEMKEYLLERNIEGLILKDLKSTYDYHKPQNWIKWRKIP